MAKFKANRDRYQSDVHVNAFRTRYYISEKHRSLSDAQSSSRLTRKEEKDLYDSQGIKANFFTHIYKIPSKKYKRIK